MMRLTASTVVALALASGCHAELAGNPTGGVDAPSRGDDAANVDADSIVTADAAPTCANGRVVFLDFDGVTLTRAAASDAKLHHASWMQGATATIPRWNTSSANRATDIATIVAGVKTALTTGFPGPISVVTTEPTSGEYVMVVFGGTSTQSTSRFGNAVNELDCDDSEKSDVAWIRDYNDPVPTTALINNTLGAIGFGLGLTATNDNRDCMCAWANGCTKDQTQVCTYTENIARDPSTTNGGTATQTCVGAAAIQNEHTTVRGAFCN
ncbi:MAG: hypothetical protein NT062_28485 [Proteobacteria bacterium]|nr:hypothetical protein [Pseudomonadota bacterium]